MKQAIGALLALVVVTCAAPAAARPFRVLSLDQAAVIPRRMATYPDHAVYVATGDDRVVGTFALLIMDNLAHLGAPSAVVEDVVVDERHRGRGIGRALMTFAIDHARARGCYKLALSSNTARPAAHAFYRALGFQQHGLSFAILALRE